jgi:hypothetical protein
MFICNLEIAIKNSSSVSMIYFNVMLTRDDELAATQKSSALANQPEDSLAISGPEWLANLAGD